MAENQSFRGLTGIEVAEALHLPQEDTHYFLGLLPLWKDSGVIPSHLLPTIIRKGRGTKVLYPLAAVDFFRDALDLREYGSLKGQHHALGSGPRRNAGLRILLASRGWPYPRTVLIEDIIDVARRFASLTGPLNATNISEWLFLGKRRRRGASRALFGPRKLQIVMAWWSVLAGAAIKPGFWEGAEILPQDVLENAVRRARPNALGRWLAAARPFVTTFCYDAPRGAQTVEELDALMMHPPSLGDVQKDNVTTHLFRALNRRLDREFSTTPDDIHRWQKELKQDRSPEALRLKRDIARAVREAKRLALAQALARAQRWTWYDGQLYDRTLRAYVYRTHDSKALLRPSSIEDVLKRFLRYLAAFVSLAVATTDPRSRPKPPYEPAHETRIQCWRCKVSMRMGESDYQAAMRSTPPSVPTDKPKSVTEVTLWCPSCFDKRVEIPWLARGYV